MERRTVLAFVLMFAVLVGWNLLFAPEPPAPDETTPSQEPVAVAGGDRSGVAEDAPSATRDLEAPPPAARELSEGSPGSAWLDVADGEIGQTVPVVTDRFVAEIDLVGGDILSWKLRDYEVVGGGSVELVPGRSLGATTQRAHALQVIQDGRAVDLANVRFQSNVREMRLSQDRPQGRLELRAVRPNGDVLTLSYVFQNETYGFDVNVRYESSVADPGAVRWQVAWPGGIASSEPDTVTEYNDFKAVSRVGADVHRVSYNDLKGDGNKGRAAYEGTVAWAGVVSRYFTSLVILPQAATGTVRTDGSHPQRLQTFETTLPLERGQVGGISYSVYMGPLDEGILGTYPGEVARIVDLGPAIFRPLAHLTLVVMKAMHRVIPNYGWVIVLISALTKVLFYPLTKSSTQSMRKMQEMQPQIQKLRERYKDDQQKQSQEMMALYKREKINPAGGCLPILVQMPVFIALYNVLRKTIELRQAGWLAWIDDLSRPDVLFKMPLALPILGNNFSLLPILMAAGMWAQSKLSTPSNQGKGAMASQARMMVVFMPLFMFIVFYNSPSGLVLYWLVNTVLTAAQTWKIHRDLAPSAELTPEAGAA